MSIWSNLKVVTKVATEKQKSERQKDTEPKLYLTNAVNSIKINSLGVTHMKLNVADMVTIMRREFDEGETPDINSRYAIVIVDEKLAKKLPANAVISKIGAVNEQSKNVQFGNVTFYPEMLLGNPTMDSLSFDDLVKEGIATVVGTGKFTEGKTPKEITKRKLTQTASYVISDGVIIPFKVDENDEKEKAINITVYPLVGYKAIPNVDKTAKAVEVAPTEEAGV